MPPLSDPASSEASSAEPAAPSRAWAWALTLTATSTMAVSYLDRQTLAVLGPTVKQQLHIDNEAFGWLISAFSIAYLVGSPISGRLVDHIGARRGLLGAVLLWSAVAAAHALVPGFAVLFALRIALGLAESPSFPGAAQTVHRALPPADRARGLGILFTGSSFGAMVAPKLATFIASKFSVERGFRVAFLGTAIVGLLWVPLWLAVAFRKDMRALLDHRPAPPIAERASAGDRGGLLSLLAHPAVLRASLVVIASAPLINLYFNWGANYLVAEHGLVQAQVGNYLWLPPILFDLGAISFGHRASRARAAGADGVPPRLLAIAGVLMCAGALIPLARTPWEVTLLISVSLSGGGGLFSLATAEMMTRVPASRVSAAGGLTAAAQSLAYIVANPLIGRSIDVTKHYTLIILALTAWVIPGTLGWLLWKQRTAGPLQTA
ncbi:MAG: MFS transporter [Byssovorax sp.]